MKSLIVLSLAVQFAATVSLFAQTKLTFDDKARFLSEEVESLLKTRLEADNIEFTYNVDFKKKCEFWFATTYIQNDELFLTIKDCNEKTAGTKNLGVKIITAADADKAMLMYFAISEIINNPYKDIPQGDKTGTTPATSPESAETPVHQIDPGQHRSRYFFAPSSYNLEEGELYYNSLYFFLHDLQYGISDQFSLGMGTTIIGFPFYVTPKITIPYNEKSNFALGDMLILGTWNSDFFGNLLYGTYTRGDYRNNVTVGGGYLYTQEGDLTLTTNAPVFNFSALGKVSDHIFFITENYSSQVKTKQTADNSSFNPITVDFKQNVFFIYGMTGFRFINRTRDVISWQLGLTYLYRSGDDIPVQYTGDNWYTSAESGSKFITFPVVGFTRKFGLKY